MIQWPWEHLWTPYGHQSPVNRTNRTKQKQCFLKISLEPNNKTSGHVHLHRFGANGISTDHWVPVSSVSVLWVIKVWCFDVSISLQTGFRTIGVNKQYDRLPYCRLRILWFIYVSLEALTACFCSQQHLKTSFEALNTAMDLLLGFHLKIWRWRRADKVQFPSTASLLFLTSEVSGLFCVFKAALWGPSRGLSAACASELRSLHEGSFIWWIFYAESSSDVGERTDLPAVNILFWPGAKSHAFRCSLPPSEIKHTSRELFSPNPSRVGVTHFTQKSRSITHTLLFYSANY